MRYRALAWSVCLAGLSLPLVAGEVVVTLIDVYPPAGFGEGETDASLEWYTLLPGIVVEGGAALVYGPLRPRLEGGTLAGVEAEGAP